MFVFINMENQLQNRKIKIINGSSSAFALRNHTAGRYHKKKRKMSSSKKLPKSALADSYQWSDKTILCI
jgi:hypothetical protein